MVALDLHDTRVVVILSRLYTLCKTEFNPDTIRITIMNLDCVVRAYEDGSMYPADDWQTLFFPVYFYISIFFVFCTSCCLFKWSQYSFVFLL